MRILLVEDDLDLQSLMKGILTSGYFDVDVSDNGRDALDYVLKNSYDLIITDILMPKLNGLAFMKAVRDLPTRACNTPIIAMSGGSAKIDKTDALNGASFYANDIISKPFNHEEVFESISNLLSKSKGVLKDAALTGDGFDKGAL